MNKEELNKVMEENGFHMGENNRWLHDVYEGMCVAFIESTGDIVIDSTITGLGLTKDFSIVKLATADADVVDRIVKDKLFVYDHYNQKLDAIMKSFQEF